VRLAANSGACGVCMTFLPSTYTTSGADPSYLSDTETNPNHGTDESSPGNNTPRSRPLEYVPDSFSPHVILAISKLSYKYRLVYSVIKFMESGCSLWKFSTMTTYSAITLPF